MNLDKKFQQKLNTVLLGLDDLMAEVETMHAAITERTKNSPVSITCVSFFSLDASPLKKTTAIKSASKARNFKSYSKSQPLDSELMTDLLKPKLSSSEPTSPARPSPRSKINPCRSPVKDRDTLFPLRPKKNNQDSSNSPYSPMGPGHH